MKKVVLLGLSGISPMAMADLSDWVQPMSTLKAGDTTWVMVSAILVLFMTILGLALFYAGMVRKKNVLATMMQSFAVCCLIAILWMCFGYSLAFTPNGAFVGGTERFFIRYERFYGKRNVNGLSGRRDDSGVGLYGIPNGICHHCRRDYYRRLCGKNEIFGIIMVRWIMVFIDLRAYCSLGMGHGWLVSK